MAPTSKATSSPFLHLIHTANPLHSFDDAKRRNDDTCDINDKKEEQKMEKMESRQVTSHKSGKIVQKYFS
jgi:hypothetical protein